MLKCSPEAFAKCPNRLYCGSYPSECSFTEGSDCDKFNRQVENSPKTNADRIRAMSDEELSEYLAELGSEANNGVIYSDRSEEWLEWLKQPAEETESRQKVVEK